MKKILAMFLVGLMLIISACSSPQKSKKYNEAIEAYNDFLNQTFITAPEEIGRYAFYDVNDDGIPELHIKTTYYFYNMFSYVNGQVVQWYEGDFNGMNGPTDLLKNGAIFARQESTGTFYEYTTFDKDGKETTVKFDYCIHDETLTEYSFDGKKVSKEQWQQLTKEYFDASEKLADVNWLSMLDTAYVKVIDDAETKGWAETFTLRNMDGQGSNELVLTKNGTKVMLFTLKDGAAKEAGSHEFYTGTLRLFYSDNKNYPGIFYFYVSGGLEQYGYISMKNGTICVEKLWDEDFTNSYDDRERIVEYTDDKEIIAESKKVYINNNDIVDSLIEHFD